LNNKGFPVNDLLRRKLQTSLTITTLALSVASTLFLLFFSSRLGIGVVSSTAGTLTLGLVELFGQFILFILALVFIIGAVLTSISVFLMMSQRTRDFALIKAVGCPNSLVGGYFMTELLSVTIVGCIVGIFGGFLGDFLVANVVFSNYALPNFWFVPLIFVVYFVLAFYFGLRPILKASKLPAIEALSPVTYYGLTGESKHKPLSKQGITIRIALRSLYRRQSASIRITFLLSVVFVLLTVTVAGGIIASETTVSSVESPVGKNTVAIAHPAMISEYTLQLSKFSKIQPRETTGFNYSDMQFAIPDSFIWQLRSLNGIETVDSRLILNETVIEKPGVSLGESSNSTNLIGGYRQGKSIVMGLDSTVSVGSWAIKGRIFQNNTFMEAIVGDSIAKTMYTRDMSKDINASSALQESIIVRNGVFRIVGICTDPLNNGYVTYLSIDQLRQITGIDYDNLVLVKISNATDRSTTINQISALAQSYGLEVVDLAGLVNQNTAFLSSTWQTIMLLPLTILVSSGICLVGYMMLSVNEQHQEFAILRAIGAKPRIIVNISAIQSIIVLLASFGIGLSFGTMITLLILIVNPVVTITTILIIAGWLLAALFAMFISSLFPAYKMSKDPILTIMAQ
jgi:ABC-type antimicrobial peptide transport system permease subunit